MADVFSDAICVADLPCQADVIWQRHVYDRCVSSCGVMCMTWMSM